MAGEFEGYRCRFNAAAKAALVNAVVNELLLWLLGQVRLCSKSVQTSEIC